MTQQPTVKQAKTALAATSGSAATATVEDLVISPGDIVLIQAAITTNGALAATSVLPDWVTLSSTAADSATIQVKHYAGVANESTASLSISASRGGGSFLQVFLGVLVLDGPGDLSRVVVSDAGLAVSQNTAMALGDDALVARFALENIANMPTANSVPHWSTSGGTIFGVGSLTAKCRTEVFAPGDTGVLFGSSTGVGQASYVGAFGVLFLEPPGAFVTAGASDRLRASIGESTGSLLSAVEAVPVEAGVSESYGLAQQLTGSTLRVWREATRDQDSAEADFAYYPSAVQNEVMEAQYRGTTALSRLRSWFPPRAYGRVDQAPLNLSPLVDGRATAQTIITHLLTRWANLVPWLEFEPVPDLRLAMPGDPTPSEYTADPALGRVLTSTLQISQAGDRRRSALDILQDLLSPFPGTIVRQNAAGRLVIVPAVGPDADDEREPSLELRDVEVYSVSRGEPDAFGRFNRATFTNTPVTRQDNVPLMQPSWFQIADTSLLGRSGIFFSPPGDRQNLQPPSGSAGVRQEELAQFSGYGPQQPGLWRVSSDAIPGDEGIKLVDGASNPLVTLAWRQYCGSNASSASLNASGTDGLTMLRTVVPFDDVWRDTFRWSRSFPLESDGRLVIACRWNEARQGIELRTSGGIKLDSSQAFAPRCWWMVEFTLNDASVGYAEGAQLSSTFGIVDDPDSPPDVLPGPSGNAIANSQNALGVLEATVNVRGYELDLPTLNLAAQSFVSRNIRPQVVRDVEVSPTGARVAAFDNLGRYVRLPNADAGRLIAVDYADDFTNPLWRKSAQVETVDPTAAGAIDTSTVWLLMVDGEFWINDDGSFSEVA